MAALEFTRNSASPAGSSDQCTLIRRSRVGQRVEFAVLRYIFAFTLPVRVERQVEAA